MIGRRRSFVKKIFYDFCKVKNACKSHTFAIIYSVSYIELQTMASLKSHLAEVTTSNLVNISEHSLVFSSIFSFWKDLSPAQNNFLSQSVRQEFYSAGTLIHRADSGCKGIMSIISGRLRVFCVSEEGREVTLYRVEKGDVCILSASCLMDSLIFDVLIEACDDTEVCLIPSAALHKIEEENPLVSLYIYKNATEKFSEVLWTIQQVLFMKIDKRLAQFLYDESIRQKSTLLLLTHEDVAKQIGSVREVVTKTLKYLAEEGIVSLGRGKIEITSKEKLLALAE